MQITPLIHVITIPFSVPAPTGPIPRSVNVFLMGADRITLIDSGVAGAEELIFAALQRAALGPEGIGQLILTHSHPDHLGAARAIRRASGCRVLAHGAERGWIEDTELQERERPVPGFRTLVGGPVAVDTPLLGGETVTVDRSLSLQVLHTPGHSPGSISLWCPEERALFSGDAVLVPGDLPIFDDYGAVVDSLQRLAAMRPAWLLSAWDRPRQGAEAIDMLGESLRWLERIHHTVQRLVGDDGSGDGMELCRRAVAELGLPPFAVNPLVARSFSACRAA
jgi:glyoxylase-like metal-dependent hydrolase (beta-lactamase superfamily II)